MAGGACDDERMRASERPEFFSPAWWDAVAAAWNAGGDTASLVRFGTAVFRLADADSPPVWMHWDGTGRAARRAGGRPDDPHFSASRQNWSALIDGRFSAGMGVLRLKIRFRGPVRRVFPYTPGLNAFARACRPFL